jgi:oligopeptide transport system substrate-binding protein
MIQTSAFTHLRADRLFDGLMRLDRAHNTTKTEIAESYTISEDGLVYEFRLSEKAHFHNGRRIEALDFKYSWERLLAPELNSSSAWYFDLVEGIEVVESDLLRVRLSERFAPFLYHLADPAASVVPREEVERLGDDFGRQPVGSGPYQFESWQEDTRLTLAAFDGHHRHKPQVKRLVYEIVPDLDEALRRYQAGELDLVTKFPTGNLHSIQQSFAAELRTFPGTFWYGFCFRCDRAPFDDPRVRRAFSLAVDRDALVRELKLRSSPSVGFLPQSIPGHDPATFTSGYDLDRGRKLLVEAGYIHGEDFPKQIYISNTGELDQRNAEFLVAAFTALGVEADYEVMEFNRLLAAQKKGDLALFWNGWGGEYPDPAPYFRPMFHSRGSNNYMAYSNPKVDLLLDAARGEQIAARRLVLYRQAEEQIRQDAPCVVLDHNTEVILLRSKWKNIPIAYSPFFLEIELAELAREGS